MKKCIPWIAALAVLAAGTLSAQDLTGTWQGTLETPQRGLRIVVKVAKDGDSLKGTMFSIDQGPGGIPVSSIAMQGSTVKMGVPQIGGSFEGKLAADGKMIDGSWTQGGMPMVLKLERATPETAWAIPEPPPPPKPMAADAPMEFEVATIKPSKPDTPGKAFIMRNGEFATVNTTLNDMMVFAYGIHVRQIADGPGWMETEKFDITAKPAAEGQPNQVQLKTMMQKLLAERFQLKFHRDKRELSVYAITVAEGGPKLEKSEAQGSLPGLFFQGLGRMPARNATMGDLAGLLQGAVLDRPVVDQTGIEGRYDFLLNWTPDEFQFTALRGNQPLPPPPADAPPDLFTAMRQQLGLKLESTKAPAEVLVIDKVEKPSEN